MPWLRFVIWRGLRRAIDLHWRNRNTVPIPQNIVPRHRLTIDPDQVILFLAALHLVLEELLDSYAVYDVNVVGETCPQIVDKKYSHFSILSFCLKFFV